jgi:hypothetical protein
LNDLHPVSVIGQFGAQTSCPVTNCPSKGYSRTTVFSVFEIMSLDWPWKVAIPPAKKLTAFPVITEKVSEPVLVTLKVVEWDNWSTPQDGE